MKFSVLVECEASDFAEIKKVLKGLLGEELYFSFNNFSENFTCIVIDINFDFEPKSFAVSFEDIRYVPQYDYHTMSWNKDEFISLWVREKLKL